MYLPTERPFLYGADPKLPIAFITYERDDYNTIDAFARPKIQEIMSGIKPRADKIFENTKIVFEYKDILRYGRMLNPSLHE